MEPWELWGHLSSTSNNRAEALALLAALEWIPARSGLVVWSDSELTVRVFRGTYKARANLDIWTLIFAALREKALQNVHVEWVRGHAGHAGNERADALSRFAAVNGDEERWKELSRGRVKNDAAAESSGKRAPAALDGIQAHGDWERQFVASVRRQLLSGRALSDKQQTILDRLRQRSRRVP